MTTHNMLNPKSNTAPDWSRRSGGGRPKAATSIDDAHEDGEPHAQDDETVATASQRPGNKCGRGTTGAIRHQQRGDGACDNNA